MPYNIDSKQAIIFNRYFADIEASTSEFQKAILPLLNVDWDKNSELLIVKLQPFAGQIDENVYRECVLATKDYINSHDFVVSNKYETTSYFYGALQYNSESQALKNLNQKLDQLMQDIPQKNTSWQESFENLWCKTASTLFSAFDFAKEHPLSTITALLYGQVALASAFPAVFNLSSLDGTNGFKINGEAEDDYSGFSVSSTGDINGDGIADLVIGVYGADPGGKSEAGSSYVIFGKDETWTTPFELSTLNGTNGFKINGEAKSDRSGYSVSSAGDINGDGIDDLIIGAPSASPGVEILAGSSYVIFGQNGTWTTPFELSALDGTNGFKINGEVADDESGYSVSYAGDINGDGIDDLIIGALSASPGAKALAGSSYVIFGKTSAWTTPFELSTLSGTNGFKINGEATSDHSGYSVSFAGDVNDDGIDDLIIGAKGADPNGKGEAGSSYVIFGKNETWTTPLELSTLSSADGFKINGEVTGDSSGRSVSAAGDINGDGVDDLVIGADEADPRGNSSAGSSYVIFGKTSAWTTPFELSTLSGTNGFKINGEAEEDYSGYSVSSAGDINGDGIADLIIGAYGADPNGTSFAGSSYVVFGKDGTWTTPFEFSTLNGITNGFKINGEAAGDQSGYSVSSAGDINGDGIDDLIIGAYLASPNAESSAGSSYIIFGANIPPVLKGNSGSIDYVENDSAKVIDNGIIVTDVDSKDLEGGMASIINNFQAEDRLNFIDQNGIAGSYNSATGVLTLAGSATLANYQEALRNITYHNLSDNPTVTPRNISFIVNDHWHDSNLIFRIINIISVDDAPNLTNSGGSFDYTENDPETIVDSSVAISDVDHVNLTNATIAITNNFNYPEDILLFMDQNGISGIYDNATGVLTLTGSSSIAYYQTALRDIAYENLADDPITDIRTITFMVSDGVKNSNAVTRDINIIALNDVPVLSGSIGSLNYTENDEPVFVDPNITVFDADNTNLSGAIISITSNFYSMEDKLGFVDQNNIVGFYNTVFGILTLSGSSNVANYQTALRSVTYSNLSEDPTVADRTISFVVSDGEISSAAITRVIHIVPVNDAPVLANGGGSFDYTENDSGTIIDSSITISDADNVDLTNATIAITNNFYYLEDILTFMDQNGISGIYNNATGVLTLTGSASIADYQTALRDITYENLADDPVADMRTITFMVNDGIENSNAVTRNINIIPINDALVLANDGGSFDYTENDSGTIIDSSITISDVDNVNLTNATIAITNNFHYPEDILTFMDQNGIGGIYNNATGVLMLTGSASIVDYQTALRDIAYENLADDPVTDMRTITFMANDGIENSNTVTRDINIISANDAPVLANGGGSFDYTENDSGTIIDSSITISDADNVDLTNATVAITNNFYYPEDILTFMDQNGISGIYNNATGVLTLTGSASIADYQTALRDITYENLADDPVADMRTVTFRVNDGVDNSNAVTRNINIIPINDAPVLSSGGGSFDYTENDSGTIIDSSITISDADNVDLTNATIAITNNFHYPEDILTFMDQNGIGGIYNNATGVLTLTGSASIVDYQTALRDITYENLADDPVADMRTITFRVNDGVDNSNAVTRNINIIPINDAPVLSSGGGSFDYTENDSGTIIDSSITISDADNVDLTNATIAITNNFYYPEDILTFMDQNGISGIYNNATGVLTLTGSASIADYQTALRDIAYENLADDPVTDMRTITFMVNDGIENSNAVTRDINIISVNDAPVLANGGGSFDYTENDSGTIIDSSITISDVDNVNLTNATVAITNNFYYPEDILTFMDQNGISGIYNNATGVLTLTGSASIADYQTALRDITYENLADDPVADMRTITFMVNDGVDNSNAVTRNINIIPINDAPVLSSGGGSFDYTENNLGMIIDSSITISDVDNVNLTNATIAITNNFHYPEDILTFMDQNGIGGIYNNATGVLMLTGSASIVDYQTALRDIAYENLADDPVADMRTITFMVNDGIENSNAVTRDINIISVNDAPVLANGGGSFDYTENDSGTIIDSSITISDVDDVNLTNVTIAITNNFHYPEDILTFMDQNGISGIYNNATGVLTLTGSASIVDYQTALRDIAYENLADDPVADMRTITFMVNDGIENSNAVTRDINIISVNDAPVLANGGGSFDYTENDSGTIIDSSITISDVDNINLTNATIAITNNFHYPEDILTFMDQNGISGIYNNVTGALTLTGSSSIANYQTALRSITYENSLDNPTADVRTVTFRVNDGVDNSNAITRDINIIPINDAPVLSSGGGSFDYTENDSGTIIDSSITISDVDKVNLTNATVAITNNFYYPEDILTFMDQNGISGIYNNATGVLTLTGSASIADYQTALRDITYENLVDDPVADMRTITFMVNDGIENSNAVTRDINITPVDDIPVITLTGNTLNYTENSGAVAIDPTLTVVDLDNANLTGAVVAIANNFNPDQDILIFNNQNDIDGSYNDTTGVLSLAGSSSVAHYQTALRSIEYENLSENPVTDPRNITFMIYNNDGESAVVSRNINIIAVNDLPVLSSDSVTSLNYTENDAPKIIDNKINIFDWDNLNLANATIAVTNNFHVAQDVLNFVNQNGIVGLYEGETGVLKLTGSSSISNYQTALRNVTYQNLFDHPSTTIRTISFMVNDGHGNSNVLTRNINIISVDDAPVITLSSTALNYTEGSGIVAIDPILTVVDVDHANLTEAIVSVASNFDPEQDVLVFIDQNEIEGSYNDTTGILSLTGSSSVANYQTALRSVEYENLSDNPTTDPRIISFIVDDGVKASASATRYINIISVNNAPVLTNNGLSLNYTENDPATVVDSSVTVFDVDNINLAGATVSITGNFDFLQDRLSFTNQNNIIGSYNSALGVLTLSGSSNVTNYQAALRNVKYNNLSEQPMTADRTIAFIVSDGQANSAAITQVIHITPAHDLPVITVSGSTLSYTEKEPAKIIDSNINIVDLDSTNLYWATVSITNNFNSAQDILSFIDQNGITGSYNNATGILTLTGTSSVVNYQVALRDVRYENLSDNPTTNPRTVSLKVNDGNGDSNVVTKVIQITTVNDVPTLIRNQLTITEGQTFILSSNELMATDPDNNIENLIFTLSNIQHGQFRSNITHEVTSRFMQRNITHGDIQFIHDGSNTAPAYSVYVSDGSSTSASAPAEISFTAVNDAPVIENNKLTINQGQAVYVSTTDLSADDEETAREDLAFIVSNVEHGYFENKNALDTPITNFFQRAIINNEIRFVHDGTEIAPRYDVLVNDGALLSAISSAAINFAKGNIDINQPSSGFEWEDKIVGAVIGGAISLIFLVLKIYLNRKAEQSFKKMSDEYQTSAMKKQADFYKNVLRPISKAIFDRVNIRGFFGYIDDVTMRRYLDAVMQIIENLDDKGVDINLEKMAVVDQTRVVNEIAKQTRKQFIPDYGCCSCASFFHYVKGFCMSDASPDELEQKAEVIALVVQSALQHRRSVMKKADIEMVDVKVTEGELAKAGREGEEVDQQEGLEDVEIYDAAKLEKRPLAVPR